MLFFRPAIVFLAVSVAAIDGCNSSTSGTIDAWIDATATCSAPGEASVGPADDHCGSSIQVVNPASCHPDASEGGSEAGVDAGESCPYGATMFGQEGDDDDCKYHVVWTSSALCEGTDGVFFSVVATVKADGSPLTGANAIAEVFLPTAADAACDDQSTHPGPNSPVPLVEAPPGTYTGKIVFDAPGEWTVRFHFHQECADLTDDSPHGHAAFHVILP